MRIFPKKIEKSQKNRFCPSNDLFRKRLRYKFNTTLLPRPGDPPPGRGHQPPWSQHVPLYAILTRQGIINTFALIHLTGNLMIIYISRLFLDILGARELILIQFISWSSSVFWFQLTSLQTGHISVGLTYCQLHKLIVWIFRLLIIKILVTICTFLFTDQISSSFFC